MKIINPFFAAILLIIPCWISAQVLMPDMVRNLVLSENFLIQIEEYNTQIARQNTSVYGKGYLPALGLNGRTSYALGNSLNRYSAIPEIKINNAGSLSGNMGLVGSYPVLTGGSRNYSNQKNEAILALSQMELRQLKEDMLLNAYRFYYQIAKSQKGLEVLEESLRISRERMEKAIYGFEFGQGSSIDTLNARVDINRDSLNIIRLNHQINNLKEELNAILCRPSATDFKVDTNVVLELAETYEILVDKGLRNNAEIEIMEENIQIAAIDQSLAVANQRPVLQLEAGYNLSLLENNENSFLIFQRSNGFQAGLNLSWSIFDGGNTYVRKQTSRLQSEVRMLQKENAKTQLEKEFAVLWNTYQTNLSIINAEKLNISTAKQNFSRSEELYKRAQIGSVEFRQAQLNLLNAQLNYYNALYDAKINEIDLKYLTGDLLK